MTSTLILIKELAMGQYVHAKEASSNFILLRGTAYSALQKIKRKF